MLSSRRCVGLCLATTVMCSGLTGCRPTSPATRTIEPIYDKASGRLQLLKYDADGDGRVETFGYMDGSRVVRIEVDRNGDGTIDRWEYYGAQRRLERVGFSRAGDGREDAWSFPDAGGAIERIELSTNRDGRANRIEHYRGGAVTLVE
jgi:hypothetical protein